MNKNLFRLSSKVENFDYGRFNNSFWSITQGNPLLKYSINDGCSLTYKNEFYVYR